MVDFFSIIVGVGFKVWGVLLWGLIVVGVLTI